MIIFRNWALHLIGYLICALVAWGCTGSSSSNSGHQCKPAANNLQFDDKVPCAEQDALIESISSLDSITLNSPTSDSDAKSLMNLMKLRELSAASLKNWMQARVHYVVDQSFDINEHLTVQQENYEYPSGPLPTNLGAPLSRQQCREDMGLEDQEMQGEETMPSSSEIIMNNISASLYVDGKICQSLQQLELSGIGQVTLSSPRVGVLKIGAGLFPNFESPVQSILLDIFRLGALFHEARHSDGHGESLGFLHAECPKGHSYEGLAVCDMASNGPYTVGAQVQKTLMNACGSQCDARTMSVLETYYLDFSDRVLSQTNWQDEPEGSQPVSSDKTEDNYQNHGD